MARPRKPENELKTPRRMKASDGTMVLRAGRPTKEVEALKKIIDEQKQIIEQQNAMFANPDGDVKLTPLDYCLNVMNNPNEPIERRDRLAVAAMPYVHMKKGEGGKRENAKENADKVAGSGKFSVAQAPTLRAVPK